MRLAVAAGRLAGVDTDAARVLRVRRSVHVELPRAGVVARVEAPGDEPTARRLAWAGELLAGSGAPAARLFRPEIQPMLVDGGALTLWRRLEAVGSPRYGALGGALRAVHDATRGAEADDALSFEAFGGIRADLLWLAEREGSGDSELMLRHLEALESDWAASTRDDPLGTVLVHGDVHIDNAIVTERGLVLIDLESAGIGAASWDLVPLAVGVRRYGLPVGRFAEFLDGYGADPGDGPGFDLMCRVYELLVTAWAMRCAVDSPEMTAEARVRVDGFLRGGEETWKLI